MITHTQLRFGFSLLIAAGFLTAQSIVAQPVDSPEKGHLDIAHLFELGSVSDPQVSPEGGWIAYVVSRENLEKDQSESRIWMVPAKVGDAIPMTAKGSSSSHPRWSPDGKYLAFLSARDEGKTQVWRLSRYGGEAIQLTDTAQSVGSFEWSPDSRQMLLVLQDPTPQELATKAGDEEAADKTPPPWVIDRQQFKTDYVGYLDRRRTHVYVMDVGAAESEPAGVASQGKDQSDAAKPGVEAAIGGIRQLTFGDFDDSEATWSPDGKRIAFTSNRTENPDSNYNTDIWTVSSTPGESASELTQVTKTPGPDASPAWSPDGKLIAHTTITNTEAVVYGTAHLAVSESAGDETRLLTRDLDRMIFSPAFSPDGKRIWFLLEDNGEQNLAHISPKGGKVDRVVRGESVAYGFNLGPGGEIAVLVSTPQMPSEVFALKRNKLDQLTFTNRDILSGLELGEVVAVSYPSQDGTLIDGFVIKPPGFVEGQRYPAILDIHGGPQSQYDYAFQFEGQFYAAQGYLVIHPNPRGSTGKGEAFCLGIWQDWGGTDFEDVMAAVDDAIERGWADPERLGVTGWSYGGMLTNHVITKTDRFKAAITGASATLYVVNYGHDMYQRWWAQELGLPWEPEARELYEKISPYNAVENVVTPTLIIGGEQDWNVPIINSEQLYLALLKLGVETQLVVYPGEYHGIDTPSHTKDLYERYRDWFKQRL